MAGSGGLRRQCSRRRLDGNEHDCARESPFIVLLMARVFAGELTRSVAFVSLEAVVDESAWRLVE